MSNNLVRFYKILFNVAPSTDDESGQEDTDEGECGPECRNLLHELEHPKEHERCQNAGMVIDIWGYCRDEY